MGNLDPIPGDMGNNPGGHPGQGVSQSLDTTKHTHTHTHYRSFIFLDWGRKPVYQEETPEAQDGAGNQR